MTGRNRVLPSKPPARQVGNIFKSNDRKDSCSDPPEPTGREPVQIQLNDRKESSSKPPERQVRNMFKSNDRKELCSKPPVRQVRNMFKSNVRKDSCSDLPEPTGRETCSDQMTRRNHVPIHPNDR
jgi:hypothetical protein